MVQANKNMLILRPGFIIIMVITFALACDKKTPVRTNISLDTNWRSVAYCSSRSEYEGFEREEFDDSDWVTVNVPHNWDVYHGYLRKKHGNLHGHACYRKEFTVEKEDMSKRYFLWFEGVGSYATVWLNGVRIGYHAGGRTSFTLDISEAIRFGEPNIMAVRVDHPAGIRDLPWVCGGCSDEWGFSEGSQPMGIFRPVHLIITNDLRIEPFGVHIWNDTTVTEKQAEIYGNTEIRNYSKKPRQFRVINAFYDRKGRKVAESSLSHTLNAETTAIINNPPLHVNDPKLWSPTDPYLYNLETTIIEEGKIMDQVNTIYGIRWINWPIRRNDNTGTFLINGKPFFINGIGEYEHQLGGSHAFTEEQIRTRVKQIRAAGFNAFRDAHQPHNLKYQQYWDELGMLWWTQMSAHIWFDTPEFRNNFKTLLREWVKERRNNPSNIMWGLQNESTLPTEFAEECVRIIRELDPIASEQRVITTCNGGSGTDWNVVQNWSGTYGGDPQLYADELSTQWLNGEYGAWRSIDLHTEGPFDPDGLLSENRMTQLLALKISQAESVRNQVCGQFLWLLSSHDNPGRFQNGDGYRETDRIGPVNYKGLITSWGEPTDAFYLYRANYVSPQKEPMVYIISHTWPNRWPSPGLKDTIMVFSNCDEVELFNDPQNNLSLGRVKNPGKGKAFTWSQVKVQYNILRAVGLVNGEQVAEDVILLNHLPEAPNFSSLNNATSVNEPDESYHYIFRVNCGGSNYTDEFGSRWMADRKLSSDTTWGSCSWTDDFAGVPDFYGSQRRTFDPLQGSNDWKLFQTFRYGKDKLSYYFPVPEGKYRVELYFIEPWYGTGGGMDCQGWRLFDVVVNEDLVLQNLDIWSEAGHDHVIRKVFDVQVKNEGLKIHFPRIASGQAIISAIAVATRDHTIIPSTPSGLNSTDLHISGSDPRKFSIETWLDIGDKQFSDADLKFVDIPPKLFGAEWIKTPAQVSDADFQLSFRVEKISDIFVCVSASLIELPRWMDGYIKSSLLIKTDDKNEPEYVLYSRRIKNKQPIVLGSLNDDHNSVPNYSVFVVPVSSLNASVDQRRIQNIGIESAEIIGSGFIRKKEDNHAFIELSYGTENSLTWEFNVGLASTYELGVNYSNPTESNIRAYLEVMSVEGIMVHKKQMEFPSTGPHWRTIHTFTDSEINAGHYRLRLTFDDSPGIRIRSISIR